MKKNLITILLFLVTGAGIAQPFNGHLIDEIEATDSIAVRWGDITGDGLLDIIVLNQRGDQTEAHALVQQDSTSFQKFRLNIDSTAMLNFQLRDFDHDGNLDIIYLSHSDSTRLVIALNQGKLQFEELNPEISMDAFLINDIDHDGDEDIIASRLSQTESSVFLIMNDSAFIAGERISRLKLASEQYFVMDEIIHVVTENTEGEQELVKLIVVEDSLIMQSICQLPAMVDPTLGDLDHDGLVDLVAQTGNEYLVIKKDGDVLSYDTIASKIGGTAKLAVGDYDLDGLADVLATTSMENSQSLLFYENSGKGSFMPDTNFFEILDGFINIPADINDDGDLDLLTLKKESNSIAFYIQLNQTTIKNRGPEPLFIHPPLTIYNETLLGWNLASDDHTDSLAISYELFIKSDGSDKYHTMPGYDMDSTVRNGFRNIVGHGYRWFDQQYTVRALDNGRYHWGVVGVDNAYYASTDIRKCVGGPCTDYYTVLNCFDLLVEDTSVCRNTEIKIELNRGKDSIQWFSVKQGFLETSPVLNFRAIESDTIYAVHFPKIPCAEESELCALNYSLAIDVKVNKSQLLKDYIICENVEQSIEVLGEWDSVRWWNGDAIISRGNALALDSIPELPIVVEAFDSVYCPGYDTLVWKEPEFSFDSDALPDSIITCVGQATEITIFQEMDVESYQFQWIPPSFFDDPQLASSNIIITEDTIISVVVAQQQCLLDTFSLRAYAIDPPNLTVSEDQEIFRSDKALLEADGADKYKWSPEEGLQSPNSPITWAEPERSTSYKVVGSNVFGCSAQLSTLVQVKNSVYIPDLFTPNGDGRNDVFQVYGEGIDQLSLKIFDERGSEVASINESSNARGWNGNARGEELPSGTYFWTLTGEFTDGESVTYLGRNKGTLRLVR